MGVHIDNDCFFSCGVNSFVIVMYVYAFLFLVIFLGTLRLPAIRHFKANSIFNIENVLSEYATILRVRCYIT